MSVLIGTLGVTFMLLGAGICAWDEWLRHLREMEQMRLTAEAEATRPKVH